MQAKPSLIDRAAANVVSRLPRRLRWKIARDSGGYPKQWVQWIYNADGDYTLKGMREKNCIFVHIPKCAGISVATSLLGNYGGAHASLGDYLSVFGADWFDRAYKFTFVRDPWTRVQSAFEFLRNGGFNEQDAAFAKQHLQHFVDLNDFALNGLGAEEIMSKHHFKTQMSYLIDPRTGEIGVDFIGRVETFANDFAQVARRLGVDAAPIVANARTPSRDASHVALNDASIARIAQIYADDIEALGFKSPAPTASNAPV